ncbi:UDP-N-acetylmuramoyl-tripeptide--D-alanyl-D-alanine ligase [Gemella cuniculi]|uniref:UDP-N-acetylmuramoyl-tripeptide--D-alanyl-D- alanine ligase n=1 Tax=Gemella cuniculi TaxID=150240 RepID=UPI0004143AB0|nr:UDP-N-acetylmuramoyl-tripeptide--D-alanyl-D-alanine ligase [Gemella cuniculi]
MKYLVQNLKKILNAKKINITQNKIITGVAIDSRKVQDGDLFIPFLGENVDGHDYIQSAFDKGAAAALCLKEDFVLDNNIIYVEDSYQAIQTLAKDYLNSLNAKIIAITGSNGKTTTKDIISDILETKYKVHKTQGNFNNELGVPLTILTAPKDSEILVLEMGADGFGQLDYLSKLVEPDFTVVTNIGESHIEFFKSREGIAKAKFEITNGMKKDGFFVFNGDEILLKNLVTNCNINTISCGEQNHNDIILENYHITRNHIDFKLNISKHPFQTVLKGKHNLFNIMFAVAIAKKIGFNDEKILESIKNISKITNMRLESIPYKENSLIINDAYNASPTSMKASIDVISDLNDFEYKTVVLGDMFELGKNEVEYHSEIGKYISENSKNINLIISVGNLAKNITNNVSNKNIKTIHFSSTNEVSQYLINNTHINEVILFKASRSMKLENIIKKITE